MRSQKCESAISIQNVNEPKFCIGILKHKFKYQCVQQFHRRILETMLSLINNNARLDAFMEAQRNINNPFN